MSDIHITGTDEQQTDKIAKLLTEPVKACPYCATGPDIWAGTGRDWIHIQCRNKKCGVRPHVEDYAPRALAGWNRRDGQ